MGANEPFTPVDEEVNKGDSNTEGTESSEQPSTGEQIEEQTREEAGPESRTEQAQERPVGLEEQKTIQSHIKQSISPSQKPSGDSALNKQVAKLSNQVDKQSEANKKTVQTLREDTAFKT